MVLIIAAINSKTFTVVLQGTVVATHSKTNNFYIDDGSGVAKIYVPPSLLLRIKTTSTVPTPTKTTSRTTGGRRRNKRSTSSTTTSSHGFRFPSVGTLVTVWATRMADSVTTFAATNYVSLVDWNCATLHLLESCPNKICARSPADKQRAVDELLGNLNANEMFGGFSQQED